MRNTTINIIPETYESERLYPIGFTFVLKQGKGSPKECEVLDYHVTYSSAGKVVRFRYVVGYFFALNNGYITEEMMQTTIDIATNNEWKNLIKVTIDIATDNEWKNLK